LRVVANVLKNGEQNFSIDELVAIGLINNEGSKLYMHDKTDSVKETVFQRITDRESKYFKHSGILWWSNWEEVPKGTEGGFFRGAVLSEADINFSLDIYYVCDVYTVLDTVARVGALVIAVIIIVEATPVVLANIQGIIYYCKTYGIFEGLKMYTYLGIQNLPNGVITWIQMDMADGDSSVDDVVLALQSDSVNKKLDLYLLNMDHPVGGTKANWFKLALGYDKSNMAQLAKQIVFNENTAILTSITEYGTKYSQIISIVGANGRIIDVPFIWIKNLDGVVRLVTAIPQ